jgi:hypothetical protein
MVVNDFYVKGITILPPETNTPLIVDSDTKESFSFTSELFQPIGRGHSQILKRC